MSGSCILLFGLRNFGGDATFASEGAKQVNSESEVNGVCVVVIGEVVAAWGTRVVRSCQGELEGN